MSSAASLRAPLSHLFHGTFIHTILSDTSSNHAKSTSTTSHSHSHRIEHTHARIQTLTHHTMGIHPNGTIAFLLSTSTFHQISHQYDISHAQIITMNDDQVMIPGFIDTHIHAPQYQFSGTATDMPLMEWLNHYTFPAEKRLSHLPTAHHVYTHLIRRMLRNGTTTGVYYATIDLRATQLFTLLCHTYGHRALIGKVCMDQNSPHDYIETTDAAIHDTERFIHFTRALSSSIVYPVITPRFIPTCSIQLLNALGTLAHQYNVHIQSHISESTDEVDYVYTLHSNMCNGRDTGIFDTCGLLTDKTIMAHGVHLMDDEISHLVARGTSVAHCALSNYYFGNGLFPLKKALKMGLKVGLGTDQAGGYACNILSAIRHSVNVSITRDFERDAHVAKNNTSKEADEVTSAVASSSSSSSTSDTPSSGSTSNSTSSSSSSSSSSSTDNHPLLDNHHIQCGSSHNAISYKDAFYVATLGGAYAVGMGDKIGNFVPGKSLDALLITLSSDTLNYDCFEHDTLSNRFQKFIHLGDDRNITCVYIDGKQVWPRKESMMGMDELMKQMEELEKRVDQSMSSTLPN